MRDRVQPAALLALEAHSQHNLAMRPSTALESHRQAIVEKHNGRNPRVFGSVAHGTVSDDSDLDILIDSTSETTLFDIGAIRSELRGLLGVDVDVLTRNALPDSFRHQVLLEAKVI